jgi:uncharacterized protein
MLDAGPAIKITIHLNEDTSSRDDFLHKAILSFLFKQGVAGATVFRPHAGFGVHHRIHEHGKEGWTESQHLPMRIEFVDSKAKVESLLPELYEMLTDGMIEAQETTILKIVRSEYHAEKGQ